MHRLVLYKPEALKLYFQAKHANYGVNRHSKYVSVKLKEKVSVIRCVKNCLDSQAVYSLPLKVRSYRSVLSFLFDLFVLRE